jgi:hypothetical protein
MDSFKVKLFGFTVAEFVSSEPEVVVRIDNTGGQFELACVDDSDDYDEEYEEDSGFGFRSS